MSPSPCLSSGLWSPLQPLVLLLLLVNQNQAQTVLDVIQSDTELTEFASALTLTGLDALLVDPRQQYTVFAPSNAAIAEDQPFQSYIVEQDAWVGHLRTNLQFMIVPNSVLADDQIFDGATETLLSLNGTIEISQPFAKVQLVSMERPNLQATNGMVHVVDGVLRPAWRQYSVGDSIFNEEEEDLQEMQQIVERWQFREILDDFEPAGTSWLVPGDRYLGNFSTFTQDYYYFVQQLKDPNPGQDPGKVKFQEDFATYNLLDFNIYDQDIEKGFQTLLMPRGGQAHMWLTVDAEDGTIRFNDAELYRPILANNGVTQIVKKALVPPGIGLLLGYTAEFTTIDVKDLWQFMKSSGWDLRNLTDSLQGSDFSFFAPTNLFLDDAFNIETTVRLSTLEFQRHLWDWLFSLMVTPARSPEEWIRFVEFEGGSLQIKAMNGFNLTLEVVNGDLLVAGNRVAPEFMKGIDGYIHLVDQMPLPPSVLDSTYDFIGQDPNLSALKTYTDILQLGVFMDYLVPMTLFAAVDDAWDRDIPITKMEDVLKNMMFELLWFDDNLADLDGETITSTNDREWLVTVIEDPTGEPFFYDDGRPPARIHISNAEGVEGVTNCTVIPGEQRTNILTRTGVVHIVDCLFLYNNYSYIQPDPPTVSPTDFTVTSSVITSFPSASPLDDDDVFEYTPQPETYAPFDSPTMTTTTSRPTPAPSLIPAVSTGTISPITEAPATFQDTVDPTALPAASTTSNPTETDDSPLTQAPNVVVTENPTYAPTLVPPPDASTPALSIDETTNGTQTLVPTAGSSESAMPSITSSQESLVRVIATFVMFNTEGLTAEDLNQPENLATLNKAFQDFVVDLVENVDDTQQQQQRQMLRRHLEVTLESESAQVYGIRDADCPTVTADGTRVQDQAYCQDLFGGYDLIVIDEDPDVVEETYVEATQKAVEEGKLQESIVEADPESPFVVAGPSTKAPTSAPTIAPTNVIVSGANNIDNVEGTRDGSDTDGDGGGMAWYWILIIVLINVCGCACVGFGVAHKKKMMSRESRGHDQAQEASMLMEEASASVDQSKGLRSSRNSASPHLPSTVSEQFSDENENSNDAASSGEGNDIVWDANVSIEEEYGAVESDGEDWEEEEEGENDDVGGIVDQEDVVFSVRESAVVMNDDSWGDSSALSA